MRQICLGLVWYTLAWPVLNAGLAGWVIHYNTATRAKIGSSINYVTILKFFLGGGALSNKIEKKFDDKYVVHKVMI